LHKTLRLLAIIIAQTDYAIFPFKTALYTIIDDVASDDDGQPAHIAKAYGYFEFVTDQDMGSGGGN